MQEVKEILKRLKEIYGAKSFKELADKMGVSENTIDTWRARKHIPEKHILKTLQEKGVNKTWLLTGKGEMYVAELSTADEVEVNYYPDVFASAGFGIQNYDIEPQKIKVSKFLIQTFKIINLKNVDFINVIGDSMQPYFNNGDIAVIERISSIDEVKNGDTVVANINGDIFIKKIEKIPFEKTIILKSTNPNYKDIVIRDEELEQVRIVAIVRGKMRAY